MVAAYFCNSRRGWGRGKGGGEGRGGLPLLIEN
jgi:hypothetical protein